MRDKNDRFTLLSQRMHNLEKLVRLLRRQHSRRFIKDQDICVAIEEFYDLNPLLDTYGDILHIDIRINF